MRHRFPEVKCSQCGWVHVAIPMDVARANSDTDEDLERYLKCFRCGAPTLDFVPALEGDAPMGCTLQAVVLTASDQERHVKARLAATAVSICEFKRNPLAVLRGANLRPVAVLSHNRVAFYIVEPRLFEAMMDELADQQLYCKASSRLVNRSHAIEVDIDEL